jgi:toxin YoeB
MRNINFTDEAWGDYVYWQGQDKKTLKRINQLIEACKRSPFEGIGKPEPLRESLSGYWSRRIDETNRLLLEVRDDEIIIISCRYHYLYDTNAE